MNLLSPRLRAQIVKELLSILRDPKSRYLLVVPPILQLLIFSFAATLELQHVEIGLYNRDAGRWGYELAARVGASRFVRRVVPARDENAVRDLIDRREVLAVLVIPETLSRDIAARRPATVQVILDGRRANGGQVLLGYLNAIVGDLNGERPGPGGGRELTAVRHGFNPNLDYQWFIVPSLGGVLVMFITLAVTALSIARERELGTFDQLLVSPCTPTEIIIAKIVPAMLLGLVMEGVMGAAAILPYGIPFTGSYLLLCASLLLFTLSIVGIGLMISSICATQQQAILGTFAIGVPAVLMSGFATPVENMPQFLQWLAEGIPLKHYLIIVQGSFLKAMPAEEVFRHAWPMAIIALVTLSVATVFVRGKLE